MKRVLKPFRPPRGVNESCRLGGVAGFHLLAVPIEVLAGAQRHDARQADLGELAADFEIGERLALAAAGVDKLVVVPFHARQRLGNVLRGWMVKDVLQPRLAGRGEPPRSFQCPGVNAALLADNQAGGPLFRAASASGWRIAAAGRPSPCQ